MKTAVHLFDFYIKSSLHVGLSVFSFTGISYYQLGLTPDIPVLVLVFCATVLGYNFVKYIGFVSILEKDHRKWLNEIFVLSVLFLLTGVFFFFKLRKYYSDSLSSFGDTHNVICHASELA
jgi:hypothetical protein